MALVPALEMMDGQPESMKRWEIQKYYAWLAHPMRYNLPGHGLGENILGQFPHDVLFRSTWNLKIYTSGQLIQPLIIFEINIGQQVNIGQNIDMGQISKIVNFHPNELKFKQDFHISSLNKTTDSFWGQHMSTDSFWGQHMSTDSVSEWQPIHDCAQ